MSKYTIQDIFLKYGDDYIEKHNLSKEQWKVFNAIRNCKTKELGYHICTCQPPYTESVGLVFTAKSRYISTKSHLVILNDFSISSV